jgi:hypothetical protein
MALADYCPLSTAPEAGQVGHPWSIAYNGKRPHVIFMEHSNNCFVATVLNKFSLIVCYMDISLCVTQREVEAGLCVMGPTSVTASRPFTVAAFTKMLHGVCCKP